MSNKISHEIKNVRRSVEAFDLALRRLNHANESTIPYDQKEKFFEKLSKDIDGLTAEILSGLKKSEESV